MRATGSWIIKGKRMALPADMDIAAPVALPLLALDKVLFPQAVLTLTVTDPVYLNLVKACLKTQAPLGIVSVVAVENGAQHHEKMPVFSEVGTLAKITSHSEVQGNGKRDIQNGMIVQCQGTQRFVYSRIVRGLNGLRIAQDARLLPVDLPTMIPDVLQHCSDSLRKLVTALLMQGKSSFTTPYMFADAGWVANRWAEVLPLHNDERLVLLGIRDPLERLKRVAAHIVKAQIV